MVFMMNIQEALHHAEDRTSLQGRTQHFGGHENPSMVPPPNQKAKKAKAKAQVLSIAPLNMRSTYVPAALHNRGSGD